jgi:L-amino acid N-acyltransferase YncA
MQNLAFRDATLDDLSTIVEIYNSTIPSRMVTADTKPVTVESRIAWLNEHHPFKRPLWIIEYQKGEIIGWVSFQNFYGRPAYDATAEISIYLSSSERGKGLGKLILQHCIDHCSSLGIKTLLGFIFQHNEPSLKLFRKFGFEDWGTLPNIAVLDNIEYTLKILGKRIKE